jgi:DNA mismatch repair protein MutS2
VVEGIPGRSNAFIIAQRLNFPEDRIERARSFLSQGEIRADDILDELERERQLMHKHRQAAGRDMAEARKLRRQYEEQLAQFESDKESQLSERFRELDRFLKNSQRRLESMLSHVDETESPDEMRDQVREIAKLRSEATNRALDAETIRHSDSIDPDAIEPGMRVHIRSLDMDGRVVQGGETGRVTIDIDGIRVQTDPSDLTAARGQARKEEPSDRRRPAVRAQRNRSKQIPLELNVRGMTVNEALRTVEEYLDQLLLADIRKARILHGKGTGALRDAVQSYLGSCRFVSAYGFAPPNQGGDGVTELELSESN